ncbi:MAG: tripartite tricarboxylate transporter substrate binding protein [Rhodobacteraceae bacterium]|nr:tripartite tricarboxylate transporter substrate binding protein [Paracoccaceae bacterium]
MKKAISLAALVAATLPGAALADFPVRPIQMIVPYAAGGSTDLTVRIVAETLERLYPGTTAVVRNQPGGGGGIGTSAAVNARSDGYTLGAGAQGPIAILPHLGGTDYSIDDVEFVGLYARSLQVMVACANAPFDDYDSFIASAAERAPQIGNSGAGGANHISAEAFAQAAGIAVESIPFGGSSEARTACIGGHIHAMVASPAEALSAVDSNQMTPLFVMEDERIDLFPETPTAVEKGVDFTWSSYKGIIAPKGIDDATLNWLRTAIADVVADPQFIEVMTEMGEFVTYEDGPAFEARVRRDGDMAHSVLDALDMLGVNN